MRSRPAIVLGGWIAFMAGCSLPVLGQPTPLTTELVASGLERPLYVTHAPGDVGRIFILEKTGAIKILEAAVLSVFLDIDDRVGGPGTKNSERGLLGLAFHPDYQSNGFFYVNYTDNSDDTVVSRFEVTADPNVADDTSEKIILTFTQPQTNHNGGWLSFGPDGYL